MCFQRWITMGTAPPFLFLPHQVYLPNSPGDKTVTMSLQLQKFPTTSCSVFYLPLRTDSRNDMYATSFPQERLFWSLEVRVISQQLTGPKDHFKGRQPTWFPLWISFLKINLQAFLLIFMLQNKLTDWLFEVLVVSANWCPRIWVLCFLEPIHPNWKREKLKYHSKLFRYYSDSVLQLCFFRNTRGKTLDFSGLISRTGITNSFSTKVKICSVKRQ